MKRENRGGENWATEWAKNSHFVDFSLQSYPTEYLFLRRELDMIYSIYMKVSLD